MEEYTLPVVLGIVFGFAGRLIMIKTDYRQYPTHPHGSIIHLSLGLIAAGLGAIAIPAFYEEEYTAITFLALAAQHFREVRNMERETLMKMDQNELVPRGHTYIEGIAMVFEGRNYIVIIISFFTALLTEVVGWWLGALVGAFGIILAIVYKSGKRLGGIADIECAEVVIDGWDIFVDDIHIMNVGLEESKDIIEQRALGFVITPKSVDSEVTLTNLGQRQAILHDLSVGLGMFQDEDTPSLVPLTRRDLDDGRVGVYFIPHIKDNDRARKIIERVPVLENAVRIPSESEASKDSS